MAKILQFKECPFYGISVEQIRRAEERDTSIKKRSSLYIFVVFLFSSLVEVPFITPTASASEVDSLSICPADLNRDGTVDIMDLAIVGKAWGSHPGQPSWNLRADLNDDGAANILDMVLILKDFGMKWVCNDFDEPLDWNVVSGTWSIVNGSLDGFSNTEGLIYANDMIWENYTLTAKVKIAADSPKAEAAVCIHFVDSRNYYWAGLGCWGHRASISKIVNGVSEELIFSGDIAEIIADVWYVISIKVSGSLIRLYVNDVLQLQINDSTLAGGGVGVRSWNSHVLVDSLAISGFAYTRRTVLFWKGANQGGNHFVPWDTSGTYAGKLEPDLSWKQWRDLGCNILVLTGGQYGNQLHCRLNDASHPHPYGYSGDADWANNMMAILDKAQSYGLKVAFHSLGTARGTLLGIVAPVRNTKLLTCTPINEALELIDKLGGNNELGHNFIADSRIAWWSPVNEAELYQTSKDRLGNTVRVIDWLIAVADRIHSYGGSVGSCVRVGSSSYSDFAPIINALGLDTLDFMQAHIYGQPCYAACNNNPNADMYQAVVTYLEPYCIKMMKNNAGKPVYITELGCGYGTHSSLHKTYTISKHQQAEYYRAYLDLAEKYGINGLMIHDMVQIKPGTSYGLGHFINFDGSIGNQEAYDVWKAG